MAFFDEFAAKAGQIIIFRNVATGDFVKFPAFITQFSDDYTVSWGGESIFGRIDPIKNYQSTGRRISCAFDILGKDEETALKNFQNYSRLIRMLYPVLSDPVTLGNTKSRTIIAPPLLRIKYANYMQSARSDKGLLGCIGGLSFAPKFESGHFFTPTGEMIPLVFSVTFAFEPLHEQPLGHDPNGVAFEQTFPYGIDKETEVADRQPASDGMDGD